MLEVKNLSVKLGRKEVLKDVTFNLKEGAITALLGKNGSGKTTLLRALASDLLVKKGNIIIDGNNIKDIDYKKYVDQISFLPQSLNKPAISVEQLILFARYPFNKQLDLISQQEQQKVTNILSELKLVDKKDELVCHLSSGQRQLAYFALLLAKDTKYNLLDEPTSNLDVEVKRLEFEKLKELKQKGKAILVSLHDLNDAIALVDFVVVIDEGRVVFEGETAQFVNSDLPESIFHCERMELVDKNDERIVLFK